MHLGTPEIIGLIAIGLLLFGARRLPEIMKAAGEGIREFRKASREVVAEIESSPPGKPPQPPKSAEAERSSDTSAAGQSPAQ